MTEIDPFPPGLLSRRAFPTKDGRIAIVEKWNIDTPGCPMIRNPWYSASLDHSIVFREVIMSGEEYKEIDPPLRDEPSVGEK